LAKHLIELEICDSNNGGIQPCFTLKSEWLFQRTDFWEKLVIFILNQLYYLLLLLSC